MLTDTASCAALISVSRVETNTLDRPAMYLWSCSHQQHSKQKVIFLKRAHSSSFRKILIGQKGEKPQQRGQEKKKGELA